MIHEVSRELLLRRVRCLWALALGLFALPLRSAETGDFDGDGRLSIADIVHRMEKRPAAPGSLDRYSEYPDHVRVVNDGYNPVPMEAGLAYLEFLRRSVADPLPHWVQIFDDPAAWAPLDADPRVSLSMEPATAAGGVSDRVDLTIRLSTTVRLRAISILLENDERIPRLPAVDQFSPVPSRDQGWQEIWEGERVFLGDFRVIVPFSGFLITNGRYVAHRGLTPSGYIDDQNQVFIEPGEYRVVLPLRLPKGIRAGSYQVKVLVTSEVVLEDLKPVAPVVGLPVDLVVQNDVTVGWDDGVPPLDIDPGSKRVLGRTEYRLANQNGEAPADGEPVVIASPGEDVRVRVQMRTEVPLKRLTFRLEWRSENLRCVTFGSNNDEAAEAILVDPEDGRPYPAYRHCEKGWGGLPSNHSASFQIAEKYGNKRPLEYFKPLGEWRDLTEVPLHVNGCAVAGEEIPLSFRRYSTGDFNSWPGASYHPYGPTYVGAGHTSDWEYEVEYQDGFIRVSDAPLRCPDDWIPDPGVRFLLGSVAGSPGQTVEVPILASAENPAEFLELALESDPPEVIVEGAWVAVKSRLTGKLGRMEASGGEEGINSNECDGAACDFGIPAWLKLWGKNPGVGEVEDRFALVSIGVLPGDGSHDQDPFPDYPGKSLVEIGGLRVTIPADFTGSEIRLRSATVPVLLTFAFLNHETGGFRAGDFFPAKEFREGVIHVVPPGKDFLRGDANLDRTVDLSDAVTTLTFLFLGGSAIQCEDAADADDNGAVEITDAIFLLGSLFLGNGAIPPPSPGCGPDPQPDGLGCEREGCGSP